MKQDFPCLLWLICLLVIQVQPGAGGDETPPGFKPRTLHTLSVQGHGSLKSLLKYSGDRLPVVSAHRGGSGVGLPENCIATFEATLQKTYALLEVDPRLTRDGVIVLHHDATLERTTTGTGTLNSLTFEEVRKLKLKDSEGVVTDFGIPTLDEALTWAQGKAVLILDQKDVSLEARVKKISEFHAESWALLIVYRFEDAQRCYAMNPEIMMEVMIPDLDRLKAFENTGVPWDNVIAFTGHEPPQNIELFEALHRRGVLCVAGTSRNLDKQFLLRQVPGIDNLRSSYESLFKLGVDVIETDIPRETGPMLLRKISIPETRKAFFTQQND